MSRILEMLIVEYPQASGIYHVSSQPINKYDLLNLIKTKMRLSLKIIPDETFKYDRSLNSERFRREFKYRPPSWDQMMDELCNDLLSTKA
jgi:dTDP-4-dehydrorhamnose reductase